MGSANAVTVYDFEGDGFWMVEEETVDVASLVCQEPNMMLGAQDAILVTSHHEEEKLTPSDKWIAVAINPSDEDEDNQICVELYDSSAT